MRILIWSILFCSFLLQTPLIAQSIEVCDNAIDDDGDGLIDQNDEDCFCKLAEVVSLIPNPSFEDQNCCPGNRSQMDCATTWEQASFPTTDYAHTCGWMGWEDFPMPLPIPDGEGAIGFRDGQFVTEENNPDFIANPNWKEYAGTCLTRPLRAGVNYKFKFFVGFTVAPFSPAVDITFFGTTDCDNLPFGENKTDFGCPTNGQGWQALGSVIAFGDNEWKEFEIEVTPTEDITAIAIGPPCTEGNYTHNTFYFFDNLILAEESAFEFDIKVINHPCAPNARLELPEYDTLNYQWYKNGVALVGEMNAQLMNPPGTGNYSVVFTNTEGCSVTKSFRVIIPTFTNTVRQTICRGDAYLFGSQQLTEEGAYLDTFQTINGCDSIVRLELSVDGSIVENVEAKIFPNESYQIGSFRFDEPGTYSQAIPSNIGCDSIVNLTLKYYSIYIPNIFSPNGDGINDIFIINGGTDLQEIRALSVFDRWGNLVYSEANNDITTQGWDGKVQSENVAQGVYLYTAKILMDDGLEREMSGQVTLIR